MKRKEVIFLLAMLLVGTSVGVLHIQVIVMQQQQRQKVLRNKVFIHWPTIILKSSLSVMGNTCLEIKQDMKLRQIQPIVE